MNTNLFYNPIEVVYMRKNNEKEKAPSSHESIVYSSKRNYEFISPTVFKI